MLQDLSKTTVVGTSTAGKAVIQEYFSLVSDKAAVRLTVGEIKLMKSGKNWAEKGLMPDRLKDLAYDKLQRFDLLTYGEDDQLRAAVEAIKSNQTITTPDNSISGSTTSVTAPTTTTAPSTETVTTTTTVAP